MVKQRTHFLPGTTGAIHTKAKTYRKLQDKVTRAVAAYGRVEVLTYLRFIAYLSYT